MNDRARYIKIVQWSDEDQCFVGQCPGVVGPCCHGDNEAEVYAELCEIVEECIEMLKVDGKPLPPPTARLDISTDNATSTFIALAPDELLLFNNALNEVLNGADIEEPEFATRLGTSQEIAAALLNRVGKLINSQNVK